MACEYNRLRGAQSLGFAKVISVLIRSNLFFHFPCTRHNLLHFQQQQKKKKPSLYPHQPKIISRETRKQYLWRQLTACLSKSKISTQALSQ